MVSVGVRELKNRLSYYLRLVRDGEQVVVTDRGREVAILARGARDEVRPLLERLRAEGIVAWGGQSKRPLPRPVLASGRPTSDLIIEDRR